MVKHHAVGQGLEKEPAALEWLESSLTQVLLKCEEVVNALMPDQAIARAERVK